ncbi:hypothetical protein BDR03DRAFT_972547 [Suillus americanus]|nr:hypothetical protein BDR03DRAFT_972547 [Suillus americanus]
MEMSDPESLDANFLRTDLPQRAMSRTTGIIPSSYVFTPILAHLNIRLPRVSQALSIHLHHIPHVHVFSNSSPLAMTLAYL